MGNQTKPPAVHAWKQVMQECVKKDPQFMACIALSLSEAANAIAAELELNAAYRWGKGDGKTPVKTKRRKAK